MAFAPETTTASLAQNAGRHCARVAQWPAASIDRLEELIETGIEGGWLLKIERMPGIRHHHERRAHYRAFHQQRRLKAGPVLVPGHHQSRNCHRLHPVNQVE